MKPTQTGVPSGPSVAAVGKVKPTARELAMMSQNRKNALANGVSKLGGLERSPLKSQTELWQEFTALANDIDPDAAWSDLMAQYMRDWIQGMWIVRAIEGGTDEPKAQ